MSAPDISAFAAAAQSIEYPDADSERQTRQLFAGSDVSGEPGTLGSAVAELASWTAGVQGQYPPHGFARIRTVTFAGDHVTVAESSQEQHTPATAATLAEMLHGAGAMNVVAPMAGATVRLVDVCVDGETAQVIESHKIRAGSGRIDIEDSLVDDEARRAFAAGIALADDEIDSGADLLVVTGIGKGLATAAGAIVSVLTATEPVKVVSRGEAVDDTTWARRVTAIRDARRRSFDLRSQPEALVRALGGADIAVMAAFIARAASRRTPVMVDGLASCAAAMVTQAENARVVRWLHAGAVSAEPAHAIALHWLGLKPILELGAPSAPGIGSLMAVPLLSSAIGLAQAAHDGRLGVGEFGAGEFGAGD